MYEISEVVVPGGVLKYQAKDIKELIELSAFIQSLPKVCPCDGTPTRFLFQDFDGDKYYGVAGTGQIEYVYKYGIAKDGGDLFPKGRWSFFYAPLKKELVVMENGQICPKCWWWDNTKSEKIFVNVPNPLSSPGTLAGNGKRDYAERVPVADRDALDEAIDAAFGGEDAPLSQDGPRLGNATKGQLGTMHALGIALYGDARTWDIKRPVVTKHISQGRVESSAMLTQAEIIRLIFNLEAKIREHYDLLADKCLQHGVTIENVDPDELSGVPLAHSYTAATKAFKERKGERVAA